MKVILHIGVAKTGTTYIQRCLHQNTDLMIGEGFFYRTRSPEEYNHSALVPLFSNPINKNTLIEIFDGFISQASDAGCHTCIFSSEAFVDNVIDFDLLREIFKKHELKIIAYMRRPDELFSSAHNQMVRDSFSQWPRSINERPYPYDPSYQASLGRWVSAFNPSEMVIAPYDFPQIHQGDLIYDFLSMAGLDKPLPFDKNFSDENANSGLPDSLIEVLRMSNAILKLSPSQHSQWVSALHSLRASYPKLYPLKSELMDQKLRQECFRALGRELHKYRPYFRPGFEDSFLSWRAKNLRSSFNKFFLIKPLGFSGVGAKSNKNLVSKLLNFLGRK
jgi:hypothetical protein